MDTQTLTMILVVLLVLERIIRAVAPMTATTVDDQAVAMIDQARSWSLQQAPHIWAIVEQLASVGSIPKIQKSAEFLLRLKAAYAAATGKMLPEAAAAEAQTVAAGLSAGAKLPIQSVSEVIPANPQPAPASR